MGYHVIQIEVDECCSYVAVGWYATRDEIPDRYLRNNNYEIDFDGEGED